LDILIVPQAVRWVQCAARLRANFPLKLVKLYG
jgi:hypothetical protein